MPLYEYQCKQCGHRFEKIVRSYASGEVKECPVCGGEVEQLLSAPAVQFKGSGFYSTDYAKPAPKSAQKAADGAAKSPEGGTAPSGDSAISSSESSKPAPATTPTTTANSSSQPAKSKE